jgi:ankyrin repeat protein
LLLASKDKHNVDLDKATNDGVTPLLAAVQNNHLECVQFLVKAGVSLIKNDIEGKTALDYALENKAQSIIELLQERIKAVQKKQELMNSLIIVKA